MIAAAPLPPVAPQPPAPIARTVRVSESQHGDRFCVTVRVQWAQGVWVSSSEGTGCWIVSGARYARPRRV